MLHNTNIRAKYQFADPIIGVPPFDDNAATGPGSGPHRPHRGRALHLHHPAAALPGRRAQDGGLGAAG
eukprot:9053956-Pyramimonas_sp.AAC.1